MLPFQQLLNFPHSQQVGPQWRPVMMNGMNQQAMFMSQNMHVPMQQAVQMAPMPNQLFFDGNNFTKHRGPGGPNQWNQLRQQRPSFQQQQYLQNNQRHKNKRKSSDADLSEGRGTPKQSRSPGYGPDQQRSSQSSLNISNSTAMHTSFVDGAKRILHVPGQPCERITEAIVEYYNNHRQKEDDLRHKLLLSQCLNAIVKDIFPGCRLFIVGSSLSGFGTHTSDMDLCLLVSQRQFIDQRIEAVQILTAIHRSLRNCSFVKSSQVIRAKVPILKFTDKARSIECDLNVNNGVGIRNTHLLKYYCLYDNRVAPLMLFIKFWARFHDINDARKRTISSYSLGLMLIHYLQACTPPVLPCLQKLYPDHFAGNVDVRNLQLNTPLPVMGSSNTESLGKLFQGFLDYYAFTFKPEHHVISVRRGCLLEKRMVQLNSREPNQWKCLCVEEPFDLSNTARSVFDPNIFTRVHQVFRRSAEALKAKGDVSAILEQPF